MLELDDVLAEPLGDRDDDLRGGRPLFRCLGKKVFVALITRLGLRLAGARARRDPLLLAGERLLAGFLLAALLLEALLLLAEP